MIPIAELTKADRGRWVRLSREPYPNPGRILGWNDFHISILWQRGQFEKALDHTQRVVAPEDLEFLEAESQLKPLGIQPIRLVTGRDSPGRNRNIKPRAASVSHNAKKNEAALFCCAAAADPASEPIIKTRSTQIKQLSQSVAKRSSSIRHTT